MDSRTGFSLSAVAGVRPYDGGERREELIAESMRGVGPMPRFPRLTREFEIATRGEADAVVWHFDRTVEIEREFTLADDRSRTRPNVRVLLPIMLAALREWQGVLDEDGRPVAFSESAFYEYVPPSMRLEVFEGWVRVMRGEEAEPQARRKFSQAAPQVPLTELSVVLPSASAVYSPAQPISHSSPLSRPPALTPSARRANLQVEVPAAGRLSAPEASSPDAMGLERQSAMQPKPPVPLAQQPLRRLSPYAMIAQLGRKFVQVMEAVLRTTEYGRKATGGRRYDGGRTTGGRRGHRGSTADEGGRRRGSLPPMETTQGKPQPEVYPTTEAAPSRMEADIAQGPGQPLPHLVLSRAKSLGPTASVNPLGQAPAVSPAPAAVPPDHFVARQAADAPKADLHASSATVAPTDSPSPTPVSVQSRFSHSRQLQGVILPAHADNPARAWDLEDAVEDIYWRLRHAESLSLLF